MFVCRVGTHSHTSLGEGYGNSDPANRHWIYSVHVRRPLLSSAPHIHVHAHTGRHLTISQIIHIHTCIGYWINSSKCHVESNHHSKYPRQNTVYIYSSVLNFTRHSLIRLHVWYVLHIYDCHYEHLAGLTNSVSTPKYTGNHMYIYIVLHHASC